MAVWRIAQYTCGDNGDNGENDEDDEDEDNSDRGWSVVRVVRGSSAT